MNSLALTHQSYVGSEAHRSDDRHADIFVASREFWSTRQSRAQQPVDWRLRINNIAALAPTNLISWRQSQAIRSGQAASAPVSLPSAPVQASAPP